MGFSAINEYLKLNSNQKLDYIRKELAKNKSDFVYDIFDDVPVLFHKNSHLDFVFVPAGTYFQGFSKENQTCAEKISPIVNASYSEMRPVVERKIEKPFLVTRKPILNLNVLGSSSEDAYFPYFCDFQSAQEFADNVQMRLPTETEWEYFARAGSNSLFPFGNHLIDFDKLEKWMNYCFYDLEQCCANNLGIYGIFSGEWTSDFYRENYMSSTPLQKGRVIRGGGAVFWPWQDQEWVWCMSAMRMPSTDLIDNECCFRLVMDI